MRFLLALLLLSTPAYAQVGSDFLNMQMITEGPSILQTRIEWSGEDPLYVGRAVRGAAATDQVWTINKFTLTGGKITLIQTAVKTAWDDRTAGSYL